jgi:hypothetical protein
MDDLKRLIDQLDSLVEDKDTDHEYLKSVLECLVKIVGAMVNRALENGNKFAAARYSELLNSLVKHLGQLEATRV